MSARASPKDRQPQDSRRCGPRGGWIQTPNPVWISHQDWDVGEIDQLYFTMLNRPLHAFCRWVYFRRFASHLLCLRIKNDKQHCRLPAFFMLAIDVDYAWRTFRCCRLRGCLPWTPSATPL